MGTIAIACSEVRPELTSDQAITLAPIQLSSKSSKSGERSKPRKGPPPDVLRKSGPHKDKKRRTGREPIRRDELNEKSD